MKIDITRPVDPTVSHLSDLPRGIRPRTDHPVVAVGSARLGPADHGGGRWEREELRIELPQRR